MLPWAKRRLSYVRDMVTRRALASLVSLLSSRPAGAGGFVLPASRIDAKSLRRCDFSGCSSSGRHFYSIRLTNTETNFRRTHLRESVNYNDAASEDPRERAREAFSKLAKRGRSWRRLRHLVDLACLCDEAKVRSIADVGCDHGLLSIGLAVSGRFERVVGVDVSEQALNDGAITLLRDLKSDEAWIRFSPQQLDGIFPVEFVAGNGLKVLQLGQADALCIAGMGVNSMMRILDSNELKRVGCQFLVLQPTNSRPRNLVKLYDFLADSGWRAKHERMENRSSRWYISTLFAKEGSSESASGTDNETIIPGQLLTLSDDAYESYVEHHRQWIERDIQNGSHLYNGDRRWLESVGTEDKGRDCI